tara:strand:+ start:99 stop:299 length:201 start_codon:yes stop_codon:yes gene_type:complete
MKPQQVVADAFRKNGGNHSKAKIDALTQHLMNGGSPASYGERLAQMALQMEGFLPTESEKRAKFND